MKPTGNAAGVGGAASTATVPGPPTGTTTTGGGTTTTGTIQTGAASGAAPDSGAVVVPNTPGPASAGGPMSAELAKSESDGDVVFYMEEPRAGGK